MTLHDDGTRQRECLPNALDISCNRETFRELLKFFDGKEQEIPEYNTADTLSELKVFASYRIALAAWHLMSSFRRRRMPGLFLTFMRLTNPRRFESWWRRNDHLFSECLLFMIAKLLRELRWQADGGDTTIPLVNDLRMELATMAAIQYSRILRMNQHEQNILKDTVSKVLLQHEDQPPADDADRLHRIASALGRKPSISEVALLTRRALLGEALSLIGPIAFDSQYHRLLVNNEDEYVGFPNSDLKNKQI